MDFSSLIDSVLKSQTSPTTTTSPTTSTSSLLYPGGSPTFNEASPTGTYGSGSAGSTSLSSFTSGMTPDQVRALANQYISAGGVQNIDNGQYWVDKYNEWGASDPGYFQTRLIQGIGDQGGYNGYFGNVSTPSGNLSGSFDPSSLYSPSHLDTGGVSFSPNTYGDPGAGYSSTLSVVGVAGPDWESKGAGGPDWVQLSNGAWVPPDHPLAQLAQSLTTTGTSTPTGNTQAGASQTLLDTLLARATQGLDVNPNDPVIRNQTDAYSAAQQTGARNYLRQAAEKAGVYGGTNISAEARAANENAAKNTAGFTASLIQNELQAKRTEIQNALTSLQGYLTDQQKLQLQKQLSDLDRALQYARLNEQSSEFGASLGEQGREFDQRMAEVANELAQRAYEFDTSQANGVFL